MTRHHLHARRGFTLIELLVVISIIALLISILVPVLGSARKAARASICRSNQRQLGLANAMYLNDFKGQFPYPTTAFAYLDGSFPADRGKMVWFVALDPYLNTLGPDDPTRSGVAGQRAYKSWKQCPDIDLIPALPGIPGITGAQNVREFARTFKINVNLRHLLTTSGARKWRSASDKEVSKPVNTVTYGDGNASDLLPWPTDTNETGKFGMDVNSTSEAGVGIRHSNSANILFADGHVMAYQLPTYERMSAGGTVKIRAWYGEYDSTGNRRSEMPLIWSEKGRFQNNY